MSEIPADEAAALEKLPALNWFRFHPATAETGPIHDGIRGAFRQTARHLLSVLPEGPDKTVALRKLQDAMMSANACVANNYPDGPAINPHSGATP